MEQTIRTLAKINANHFSAQLDTVRLRTGKITERPTRDTIPVAAEEQLIVELYSK